MPSGLPSSATQSPALSSFATLRANVQRFVKLPDDTDAAQLAGDSLNDGVNKLNERTWYWSLTYYDITLAADTASYLIPSDFKSARAMERLNASNEPDGRLDYLDPKSLLIEFDSATSSGDPCTYTVMNHINDNLVTLDVPASSAFVAKYPILRLHYFRRVQKLVDDDDVLLAPSEAEGFVTWYARFVMATMYDLQKSGIARREADETWRALVRDDNETHYRDWTE